MRIRPQLFEYNPTDNKQINKKSVTSFAETSLNNAGRR